MLRESDLYAPVKAFLEARGYDVKAEVNGCDIVACKADAPPVIVELKLVFSLSLVFQGIERQSCTDDIYLVIPAPDTPTKRKAWRSRRRRYIKLSRMLGLGLMTVDLTRKEGSQVEVLADPGPYTPRKNKRKQTRLVNEFTARAGDPNTGGTARTTIITAYRQDALRCAVALAETGEMKVACIRATTGVTKTASILQKNHYGWFQRTARGIYCLSEHGHQSLRHHAEILPSLADDCL